MRILPIGVVLAALVGVVAAPGMVAAAEAGAHAAASQTVLGVSCGDIRAKSVPWLLARTAHCWRQVLALLTRPSTCGT